MGGCIGGRLDVKMAGHQCNNDYVKIKHQLFSGTGKMTVKGNSHLMQKHVYKYRLNHCKNV